MVNHFLYTLPVRNSSAQVEAAKLQRSLAGCLLGAAVGDALGLPCEALSRRRQSKLFRNLSGHRFLFGRGMISDDTEHLCMVAQALIVSAGDPQRFARSLGWRLRWWLWSIPPAIGFATLRALIKLWIGFPSSRSGVFSAGNGAAMRSAILGVSYGSDLPRLRALVKASTRITHSDPKAEWAALAVAVAAHHSANSASPDSEDFLAAFRRASGEEISGAAELLSLLERAAQSAANGESTESFAAGLGRESGVSGYAYHTVPVAIQAWLYRPDDFSVVLDAIHCGGDTDTLAAILGGIVGARVGKAGIPAEWLDGIWEWPRSRSWIERLSERLAEVVANGVPQRPLPLAVWALPLRGIFFMIVILLHGLRRMFPPY